MTHFYLISKFWYAENQFAEFIMNHKERKKLIKKIRRKNIRQKEAQERDKLLLHEAAERLNNPDYQKWLKEQEILEKQKYHEEQLQHQLEEEAWLEREKLAQIQFKYEQERKSCIEQTKKEKYKKIQKEYEELRKDEIKKAKKAKKLQKEMIREQKDFLKRLHMYTEGDGDLPKELKRNIESIPGHELCTFFSKTAACRYGNFCCKNHIKTEISRVIVIHNFYQHILLDKIKNNEYGNDNLLEFTERELFHDYADFFDDITSELEKFGKILNIRTSRNCSPHLKGNVYIEYDNERSAMKAYLNLHGRYYASKLINVEFCNFISWKNAVCGLYFTKNCTKGQLCNYLHLLKNPGNKYNQPLNSSAQDEKETMNNEKLSNLSWNDIEKMNEKPNWRWSESPEKNSNNAVKDILSQVKVIKEKISSGHSNSHRNSRSYICKVSDNRKKRSRSPRTKQKKSAKKSGSNETLYENVKKHHKSKKHKSEKKKLRKKKHKKRRSRSRSSKH